MITKKNKNIINKKSHNQSLVRQLRYFETMFNEKGEVSIVLSASNSLNMIQMVKPNNFFNN